MASPHQHADVELNFVLSGGVRPHLGTPIGKAADPGNGTGVPIEAKAGDVLAFSSLLLHKSGPNLSDGERKAYIVQYTPEGARDPVTLKLVGRGAVARARQPVNNALASR